MTLKEEFEERFTEVFENRLWVRDNVLSDIMFNWIETKIAGACKKQREICANVQTEDLEPPYRSLGELDARFKRAILNAPSPEVK